MPTTTEKCMCHSVSIVTIRFGVGAFIRKSIGTAPPSRRIARKVRTAVGLGTIPPTTRKKIHQRNPRKNKSRHEKKIEEQMIHSVADVLRVLEHCDATVDSNDGHSGTASNDDASIISNDSHDEPYQKKARRNWLDYEDNVIISNHAEIGPRWRVIAGMLNERSDDAVRNRYKRLTMLSPASPSRTSPSKLRKSRRLWTPKEDTIIQGFVDTYGQKWGQLESLLERRSAHAIRNRYVRLERLQRWKHARIPAF